MIPYTTDMGDLFSKILLENKLRGTAPERLLKRLQSERALAQADASGARLVVVALVERTPDDALRDTLMSLAMQSAPVSCFLVATNEVDRAWTESWAKQLRLRPDETRVLSEAEFDATRRELEECYITILRHGDCLHPSAAAWIRIHADKVRVDVLTWSEIQPDGLGGIDWAQRNPALEPITLMHLPYLRNAFAVSAQRCARYPGDLIREARRNELHLFQIWLLRQNVEWRSHPEFFLVRAPARREEKPETSAHRAFADYADAYARAFNGPLGEWDLHIEHNGAAVPYTLHPKRHVPTLSVIIPFRDKAELTWRSVESVARQDYAGQLEVLLINNQSRPEELALLRALLANTSPLNWRIIDYDKPFNHSAQCNLGVAHSQSDVFVFMNNDAILLSLDLLEQIAKWAKHPHIASIGVAIKDEISGSVSAGLSARPISTPYYDSPFEERTAPALIPFTREVPGNTFALAAVSRQAFETIGQLDLSRFPNGYNDIEFCCRARALGLKHVVLGGLLAAHSPGNSRGRSEENAQKLLLRQMYPAASSAGLEHLGFDEALAELRPRTPEKRMEAKAPPASPKRAPTARMTAVTNSLVARILTIPMARQMARAIYRAIVRRT